MINCNDEQNNYMSSLIDVIPKEKRNNITYHIKDVSGFRKTPVCKNAFLKIIGIGKKRIAVLLKQIQPFSGDVQRDQRRCNRNQRRIPLALEGHRFVSVVTIWCYPLLK